MQVALAVSLHIRCLILINLLLSHCYVVSTLIFNVLDGCLKHLKVWARDNIPHMAHKRLFQ